jgi:hypothetical protein
MDLCVVLNNGSSPFIATSLAKMQLQLHIESRISLRFLGYIKIFCCHRLNKTGRRQPSNERNELHIWKLCKLPHVDKNRERLAAKMAEYRSTMNSRTASTIAGSRKKSAKEDLDKHGPKKDLH